MNDPIEIIKERKLPPSLSWDFILPHHKIMNKKKINIILLVLFVLIVLDDTHGWLDAVKIGLIAACGILNNRNAHK